MSITSSRFHIKSPAGIWESQICLKTYPKCILLDDYQNALGRRARAKRVASPKCSRKPCESQAGSPTKKVKYCKNLKNAHDLGTEFLYEICFVYNSTQKASPEELLVRIFTNFNFTKIRTSSSSGLAFCVELKTKQISYRISAPRSYALFPKKGRKSMLQHAILCKKIRRKLL